MRKLNGSSWTTQQFLKLSKDLGNAFGSSLDSTELTNGNDEWTPKKLAHFSKSMSRVFLP